MSAWDAFLAEAEPGPIRATPALLNARDVVDEERRELSGLLWAAIMLAHRLDVARSILAGEPVLARQLDPAALRRALRGRPLPAPDAYLEVTGAMLRAINEAGPFRGAA